METPRGLHHTAIHFSEDVRTRLAQCLNDTVRLLIDLQVQTKLAHWNVRGPHFISYHELFDQLAGHLPDSIDLLAERAVTLGDTAGATIQTLAKTAVLPEWDLSVRLDREVIQALAIRWATAANHARHAIDVTAGMGDPDTADIYTEVSRQLDKDLWFLEAHQA